MSLHPSTIAAAKRMRAEGFTLSVIAAKLGISSADVHSALNSGKPGMNRPPLEPEPEPEPTITIDLAPRQKPRKLPVETAARIYLAHRAKKSIAEIAREFKVSEPEVFKVLGYDDESKPGPKPRTDTQEYNDARRQFRTPSRSLVDKVFGGDVEACKRCIESNFP